MILRCLKLKSDTKLKPRLIVVFCNSLKHFQLIYFLPRVLLSREYKVKHTEASLAVFKVQRSLPSLIILCEPDNVWPQQTSSSDQCCFICSGTRGGGTISMCHYSRFNHSTTFCYLFLKVFEALWSLWVPYI